ncbi:Non-reducing end alpha-L-arabinofuranosidase BoGH43B precursor [mine drainage metagenome]|uniref:Non-reducing end alpha-L-arabinofuranosidase BoGH43B n=1 Tax=mine drainage metagenome TaxID=410659 RepID=A0A1J5RZ51_9ZZZZ
MKVTLTLIFFISIFYAKAQYNVTPHAKATQYFSNPVFAGDYPDPSILKDGDTYYMVHSSFQYYPGLQIWQSKDLVNWSPVTNALHKNVGNVMAPDIAKYNNKYYIYFPANNNIYVITANSMAGPWSDPVDLKINRIDPGHIADEKGNRYLYFANGGYVSLSQDGLSVTSETKFAYSGWKIPREWSIECFCLESPKITKHGDYYYLTVAEGGTAGPATSHMIISARAKSPLGPWENSPYNPIDRTINTTEQWYSKGHGTLVEGANNKWWLVLHGYEKGYYNMGRQTLLEPVEWTKDGWFKISANIKTEKPIASPYNQPQKTAYPLSDDFSGNSLKPQWKFWDEYDTARLHFSNNSLTIKAKGKNIGESSPMLCIPSHHSYTAEVEVEIQGNAKGGLAIFYNKDYYYSLFADSTNLMNNVHNWQFVTERNVLKRHVYLKLKKVENTVDCFYSIDGIKWNKTEASFEVSGMHHNVLGGFLGLRIALCSIGDGSVTFKNFKYQPINIE